MNIKQAIKQLFQRDSLAPQQSDEDPYLYQQTQSHPSIGLDVTRIYQLFTAAEQGNIEAQSDLFTDMEERDGHLFAELSKRKRALLTLPFTVKAPPGASEAEKQLAAQADAWIRNLPGFREMMMDMLDAIGHGFACVELQWRQPSAASPLWMPVRFHKRAARHFMMPQEDLEDIRLNRGGVGEPLRPLGWIVHRHKSKSGPVAQSGLFRVLVWTYLFKNLSARDWAQFLDLYGMPVRIGKYDAGMSEKDRRALWRAVVSLGREAGGIMPKEADMQLLSPPPGQSAPFFSMIDWCEKVQSKVILGGTLTSQADGHTSTNALGLIHNEVRHDLLVGDALAVADTLTQQLLWPLLALNGCYDATRAPVIEFDTREAIDLVVLADYVQKAVSVNQPITAEWLAEKSGVPLPREGETVLRPLSRQLPAVGALSAALQTRLAALSAPQASDMPAQQQLDAAPALLAGDAVQGMDTLLRPLIASIQGATSPDAVYALLADSYTELDDAALQALLGRALFVADIWGQQHG
ncbi:DUF935 domain-containing protein [Serratia liquefaciens]|uniref:DUF935 domain-containing protein n=1 Tax=Serratia liquefaciens TaxID=614 RepID=UPI003906839F